MSDIPGNYLNWVSVKERLPTKNIRACFIAYRPPPFPSARKGFKCALEFAVVDFLHEAYGRVYDCFNWRSDFPIDFWAELPPSMMVPYDEPT